MDIFESLAPACGVVVAPQGDFQHVATCWSVGPGEWVTVLADEEVVPSANWRLLLAADGTCHPMTDWDIDGVVAGFKSTEAPTTLTVVPEGSPLKKRQALIAFGYPEVIDHPMLNLHRGSLDAERYYPYLCPWLVEGHVGLLGVDICFLAGATFNGMRGGPVVDAVGDVVGIIGKTTGQSSLPLTPFHRLC
jgi:hypothetical protein